MGYISDLLMKKIKKPHFYRGGGYVIANSHNFINITGAPIAYWISSRMFEIFKTEKRIESVGDVKKGLSTGNNDVFFRLWFEVSNEKLCFNATDYIQAMYYGKKWYPINKGGDFRKWYGNNDYVVNYYENGKELNNYDKAILRNTKYYFGESVTWTDLTSGKFSLRYNKCGFIHDVAGPCIFKLNDNLSYVMGLLNSNVTQAILTIISPTLHYNIGSIAELPLIYSEKEVEQIEAMVKENIELSRRDWDCFEFSWDFKKHPLI